MKNVTIVCDRCDHEIVNENKMDMYISHEIQIDLCQRCLSDLILWVRQKVKR